MIPIIVPTLPPIKNSLFNDFSFMFAEDADNNMTNHQLISIFVIPLAVLVRILLIQTYPINKAADSTTEYILFLFFTISFFNNKIKAMT